MTDIAITAAQIEPIFPLSAEIYPFEAAVTITKGQSLYQLAAGTCGVADANDSGKEQFIGIALNGGGAGQPIDVLKRGHCAGFTVSGGNSGVALYQSDTAGALGNTVGTMTVNVGKVVSLSDKGNLTKVVYIDADWSKDFS